MVTDRSSRNGVLVEERGSAGRLVVDGAVRPLSRRSRLARRDVLLAGLCLVVGVLSVLWLVGRGRSQVEVMVLARPVGRGEVVSADALVPMRMSPSGTLAGVTPQGAGSLVVGRVAAVDLPKGTVLNAALVSSSVVPAGKVLVGVLLKPGGFPSDRLRAGDAVMVVATAKPPAAAGSVLVPRAEVFAAGSAVRGASTEDLFVSLLVDTGSGPAVADAAAAGSVRLLGLPAQGTP